MTLEAIIKELEEEFETMTELFGREEWQFFKFGQGGPYKRTLTKLMEKSKKYDQIIFDHFGLREEIASFNKLIILSIDIAETPKDRYKNLDTLKRQIQRMKIIL